MHEFSIIQNIIDIVTESAEINKVRRIRAVEVEIGIASGVVRHALEFAWEAAVKDTLLSKADLKIKEIPLSVRCGICCIEYHPDEIYETCPGCGEISPVVITGKELRVVAIETE